MKISVTQDHIDAGLPRSPFSCPIALACQEAGLDNPGVDQVFIDAVGVHAAIPPAASCFIGDFDGGRSVQPFEFEIDETGGPVEDEDGDEEDY